MFLTYKNRAGYSALLLSLSVLLIFSSETFAKKLNSVLSEDTKGVNASQSAQIKIESLDDKTQALIGQYRQTLREQQLADKYNQLLMKQVASLESALLDIESKQAQLRNTRMTLAPLMEDMVVALENIISADAPFLVDERKARLENLHHLVADSSLTEGDKMLAILDAYQVELSYGYTTESWQGKLDQRLVNYVRIGRLGFYYVTTDGQQAAQWQASQEGLQGQWQALSADWIPHLEQASSMAMGKTLPQVLILPPMMSQPIVEAK